MAPPLPDNKLKKLLVVSNILFLLVGVLTGGLFVVDKWSKIKKRIPVAINRIIEPKIPKVMNSEIIKSLQGGGHTIYIRHSTKNSYGNLDAFDELSMAEGMEIPPDYFKAGCLADVGKAEAWLIGEAFRKLNIQVGKVYSSPTCRTKETAQFAFGRVDFVDHSITHLNFGRGPEESRTRAKKRVMDIIKIVPEVGKNKIIVGHGSIISRLGWRNSYPEQSGMFIVKHTADQQLEVVTEIRLAYLIRAMRLEFDKGKN